MRQLNKTAPLGIVLILVIGAIITQASAERSEKWNNFTRDVDELMSKVCEEYSSRLPPPACDMMKVIHDHMDILSNMMYESLKNFNDELPDKLAEQGDPVVKMVLALMGNGSENK